MRTTIKLSQRLIPVLSIFILSLFGCNEERQDNPIIMQSLVEESDRIQENSHLDKDDLKLKRKYNELILPYVVLDKDGLYKLDITEEYYSKIEVPKEVIIEIKKEIESTNKIIEQSKKRRSFY